jgi:carboxyl-terminal processing protease
VRILERIGKFIVVLGALALAGLFAARFGAGSLWRGFDPALAITDPKATKRPYDLTRLEAVNETLKMIRAKYVDPDRVKPKQMLLSALDFIQRDVAQVMVRQEGQSEVVVQVGTESQKFRVDNVQGHWDVSVRLREVFGFLQKHLKDTDVDLREVEYAACNGMLHTLDPHSTFLSPEAYKEMNMQTSGAFGGLGIVISVRDGMLTVMRPMPGTPAGRAGLKRFDRIVQIDKESTLNMPLDDAVRRLRGEPGSKVVISVVREGDGGWRDPRPFELEREIIKVASVVARPLEGGIGYIRLKTFQATGDAEVENALRTFKQQGPLRGLVLDLRGNPGGLLDQAAKIADRFLNDGVIVATVGAGEGREEKRAVAPGTEPPYPIVVLVSGSSASASEIVAGALRNLDRAVIVGETTFGKGSVQLVFPDITPEHAALKLTISQYLTPGDVSIQGVGVPPDIELEPMTVDALESDVFVDEETPKERELHASLSSSRAKPMGKPEELVRYQLTSEEREKMRELGADAEDEFRLDFSIRFARELAAAMPPAVARPDAVRAVRPIIEKFRKDELAKVSAELAKLGVDWSKPTGNTAKREDLEVRVETDRPDHTVTAGDPITLKVTVKNNGKDPVYRLRAATESENAYFDQKELLLGKIGPGEEKTATAPLGWCQIEGRKFGTTKARPENAKRVCEIPMDAATRSDGLAVKFESEGGPAPAPVEIRPTVRSLPRPIFKYAYQISDDRGGNGDGRLQRGEQVRMYLVVKNVGEGRSFDTQANLSNLSGDGLLLRDGRFDVSNMAPGDVRRVAFTFDVRKELEDDEAVLMLSVGDRDLREFATEKVKVPIEPPTPVEPASGVKKAVAAGARLFDRPKDAQPFGRLAGGAAVSVTGQINGFDRVDLGGGRYAFVPRAELEAGGTPPKGPVAFEDVYSHAPPELRIEPAALATRAETITLRGHAAANEKLLDLFGFVGGRKVFYQSNKGKKDPRAADFAVEVPLKPGVNVINVVARENPDSTTRRVVVVRRDGPDGAILKTPKDDDAADWFDAGQPIGE